ncbi:hypothetical protein DH2020_008154 [Rehmannia glutinosa]|uniref:Uncharacterized protein n=1 Tax=Rehmannia glutinosa TaxID=99300 RepID=A0ABR0U179_REHGL
MVDNDFFITEDNIGMLKLAKEANSILDSNIRARILRCSGGEADPNERPPNQRYAPETPRPLRRRDFHRRTNEQNDWSDWGLALDWRGHDACDLCGVSCTGEGEAIIRGTLARDVAALMEYKELSLQEAVDYVISGGLDDGKAGLIAVSSKGEVAYGFNSVGMFRGCATEDGFMEVGIWE